MLLLYVIVLNYFYIQFSQKYCPYTSQPVEWKVLENKATEFVFLLGKVLYFWAVPVRESGSLLIFVDHTHIQNRCSPICLIPVHQLMVMPD